jgi:UDP-N-acetyl-2-amino-2-deoxyglucuronate dehydrogenase
MSTLRVALYGCGAVAEIVADHVYPALRDLATVVATIDTRIERATELAERLGARPYPTLADATAAEPVDAVDVRLPHDLHAQAALEAIAQHRHVLLEKPLAASLEDAEKVVDGADAAGIVLAVSENYPFLEPVRVARRLLDDGVIGQILTVRSTRVYELGGVWARDGWRTGVESAAAGVLLDQGTHHVSMLRHLIGEITHVHAYASSRRDGWVGEDSVVINCRFGRGLIGQQLYCWGSPVTLAVPEATVYGSAGSLEVHISYERPGSGVRIHRPDLPDGHRWAVRAGDYYDSLRPTVEDWLLACRDQREPLVSGMEGLRDLEVVMAAYRSLDTGAEVAVASGAE